MTSAHHPARGRGNARLAHHDEIMRAGRFADVPDIRHVKKDDVTQKSFPNK
jgi:hypothetical protein